MKSIFKVCPLAGKWLRVYKFLDDVGIIATFMIETLAVVKDEARILWRGDLFSTSGTPVLRPCSTVCSSNQYIEPNSSEISGQDEMIPTSQGLGCGTQGLMSR